MKVRDLISFYLGSTVILDSNRNFLFEGKSFDISYYNPELLNKKIKWFESAYHNNLNYIIIILK